MTPKAQILEREKRWSLVAGIASVMGVAVILATYSDSSAAVRAASGLAERLREVDGDRSGLLLASFGQFLGWSLLAVPLVFLFRAAAARAPQVRRALIGVMVIAPILIGAGSMVSAGSILQAATDFKDVDHATIEKCVADKVADQTEATGSSDTGGAVTDEERSDFTSDCEDEEAKDIRGSASLASLETGISLAGLLGFTVAVVYVSLWAMRTGLLTRFWGSLGIALGVVFAFFTLFTLIWFIYAGLLLAGWVPGGRPPAWASGEARPWPKPGDPGFGGDDDDDDEDVIEGTADELDPDDPDPRGAVNAPDALDAPDAQDAPDRSDDGPQGERRKRKKRS